MSKISLAPNAAGTAIFTIESPGTSTNRTLTLPDDTGTIVTNSGNQAGSFTTLNTSGAVVFNDAGADVDFRVEGDTEANLLFVDASTNRLGVGTDTPAAKFNVVGQSRFYGNGGVSAFWGDTSALGGLTYSGTDPIIQSVSTNLLFNIGATEYMRLTSSGNVGIGTSSPTSQVTLKKTNAGGVGAELRLINSSTTVETSNQIVFTSTTSDSGNSAVIKAARTAAGTDFRFSSDGTERMRIDSSGNLLAAGKTSSSTATVGFEARANGVLSNTVNSITGVFINRLGNDGSLIDFQQDNNAEGSISVSGGTVSYNPFLGSHSGALADWSRPEIKVGTVMDTINELLEYKVVVIDVQQDVPAKDAVLDEEGNEVEPAQEATTQTVQKRISYNGNGAVGSTATVEYEGREYTGVIEHERKVPFAFNKHLKVKINDTAASKTVFGVFVGWNNDSNNDGGVYNDMLVGAVGNYVIRMAAGQTPEAGDLVEADGNGCAVVQDDDIIRTKTIAKVTSTIPQVTYDDGSFLVTCVLYCG